MRQILLGHPPAFSGLFRVSQVDAYRASLVNHRRLGTRAIEIAPTRVEHGPATGALEPGDVVRLIAGRCQAMVCWRVSDRHHTLFVTNQCNSHCLMCSQPPTPQEDGWLFDEGMEIVALVDVAPAVVGITGGEPTLHPRRLRALLDLIHSRWPVAQIEVLTNARALANERTAEQIFNGLPAGKTNWLVPLYGAIDEVHDFVVQSPGAFDETLGGLLHLQQHGQRIQLRTVLVRPVLERLVDWAMFVGRNLPFVDAVALMATEPTGFALANPELSIVDISDCISELTAAADILTDHGLRPVLMNMPLCKLPLQLRSYAALSISDWKNDYAPECATCALRPSCAGFFVWEGTSIYRTGLKPVEPVALMQRKGGLRV